MGTKIQALNKNNNKHKNTAGLKLKEEEKRRLREEIREHRG